MFVTVADLILFSLQPFPRGRWFRKMHHGVPPFNWMNGWGYPGTGFHCPNSQQTGCNPEQRQTPPAEGKS